MAEYRVTIITCDENRADMGPAGLPVPMAEVANTCPKQLTKLPIEPIVHRFQSITAEVAVNLMTHPTWRTSDCTNT